jgi:hypothetical protein
MNRYGKDVLVESLVIGHFPYLIFHFPNLPPRVRGDVES